MAIKLTAGVHEVSLQWGRIGDVFRAWNSNPSSLDGFAAARNIFVMEEKVAPHAFEDHNRSILIGNTGWATVNDNIKTFS